MRARLVVRFKSDNKYTGLEIFWMLFGNISEVISLYSQVMGIRAGHREDFFIHQNDY